MKPRMKLFGGKRAIREAMLADSVQVGMLGWPLPTNESEALREALVTLHGLRAYADRTLRDVQRESIRCRDPFGELRQRVEIVESHCASTLERLARFDTEESP